MSEARFSMEVGLLHRKNIREILESEKFRGRRIRWRESKGWIESTFEVIGADAHLTSDRLDEYIRINTQGDVSRETIVKLAPHRFP